MQRPKLTFYLPDKETTIPLDTLSLGADPYSCMQVLPPIVTYTSFQCSIVVNSYLQKTKYVIEYVSDRNPVANIKVPSRVVVISIESCCVFCINNNIQRENKKRPFVRLPKTVLSINVRDTALHRSPFGFFVFEWVGGNDFFIHSRARESLIDLCELGYPTMKQTYMPKSIRELDVPYYPSLIDKCIDLAVYNTHYKKIEYRNPWRDSP